MTFASNKTIIVFTLFMIISFISNAQDDGKGNIDAQRPTLTESYSIISTNILQFENGVDYFAKSDNYSYGTFIRGSISKKIELRAFTDYEHINLVGAKFIIMELDSTSTGIGASFVYGRDLINDSNDFRVALTKNFNNVFLTYNFGYNTSIYNIALLGIPLSQKVNYFVEYYIDSEINRVHNGFTWIPHRDIQLDINGGWMETEGWYAGLGFSFRIR